MPHESERHDRAGQAGFQFLALPLGKRNAVPGARIGGRQVIL